MKRKTSDKVQDRIIPLFRLTSRAPGFGPIGKLLRSMRGIGISDVVSRRGVKRFREIAKRNSAELAAMDAGAEVETRSATAKVLTLKPVRKRRR